MHSSRDHRLISATNPRLAWNSSRIIWRNCDVKRHSKLLRASCMLGQKHMMSWLRIHDPGFHGIDRVDPRLTDWPNSPKKHHTYIWVFLIQVRYSLLPMGPPGFRGTCSEATCSSSSRTRSSKRRSRSVGDETSVLLGSFNAMGAVMLGKHRGLNQLNGEGHLIGMAGN